jgi:RNA-binding protein YhbY
MLRVFMVKLSSRGLELKKAKIHQPRGDVNIGSRGVTDRLIDEVRRRLKTQKCLKIKVFRSARGFVGDDDVEGIAKAVNAVVIDKRGFTYVLIDRRYVIG